MNKADILLKEKLDYHYRYFDASRISPDPLEFPRRFNNYYDIEISSFISSVFAFGNVTQIIKTLDKIHISIENRPYEFVKCYSYPDGLKLFSDLKHRFYTGNDIALLFHSLNKIYSNYGSLKYFFLLYYFENDPNLKNALSFFSKNFLEIGSGKGSISHGLKFMIPDPLKGSACKRMNLFLRWMVRRDHLDFGLWNEIPASKLVIPVDTHIARICKELKLTRLKNVSWKMAEEITGRLKKFDPVDPVKYDFAICHIGMRKLVF
ncbi:MAG: TIGR02757 family protein [Melioribacteraceae bacterium]